QPNPQFMKQSIPMMNQGYNAYYLQNVQNMQNIQNYSFNNFNIPGFPNNPQHLQNNLLTNYYNNNVPNTFNYYNMTQTSTEIKTDDFDLKEFSDKLNLNAKVFVPKKKVYII